MRLSILFFLLLSFTNVFAQKDTTMRIYFNFDSYQPKSLINPFLKIDKNRWMPEVTLIGKSDTTGSAEYNRYLADFRLNAVKQLVAKQSYFQVGKSVIAGESQVDLGNYNENRERCVEITLIAKSRTERPIVSSTFPDKIVQDEPTAELESTQAIPRDFNPDSAMTKGDVFVLKNILFEINETILLLESYPELEQLVKVMTDHPTMRIHIRGNVCCAPAMELSVKRAEKIYNHLIRNGVSPTRMTFKGYSNKLPHELYKADLYDPRHRRVEIVILEQ